MEQQFLRSRLESYDKQDLIQIITDSRNLKFFNGIRPADLEPRSKEELINLLMSVQGAHIDNNLYSDYVHLFEAARFDQLYAWAKSNPQYKPDFWTPKPHQVEHIERLAKGLKDPKNESRSVLDGSEMGRGKTPSAILTAIALKVRYLLIICPNKTVRKWHQALQPLGLFEYYIMNYEGLVPPVKKGNRVRGQLRYARHKPNPDNLNKIDDLRWVTVEDTGLEGIHEDKWHWEGLPGTDPATGLGGCLVVWDEIQEAKNLGRSKRSVAFKQFTQYLQTEGAKYIRALYLSGTIIEKTDDLPYMLYAWGLISDASQGAMHNFTRNVVVPRFRELVGQDWDPAFEEIRDEEVKLIFYIRVVMKRLNKFSEIPDPVVFAAKSLGFIKRDTVDDLRKYMKQVVTPNFRNLMQEDWREEMEGLEDRAKFTQYLRHIAKDPKYGHVDINRILQGMFENPITFQPLNVQDEDLETFMRINREIEALLLDYIRGNKKMTGLLGEIQKILTDLEQLKLTPFVEIARKALTVILANGAKGSVAFGMIRNASVRQLAWRMEAILFVEDVKERMANGQIHESQIPEIRNRILTRVWNEIETYKRVREVLLRSVEPLPIKERFTLHTLETLNAMSLEDLYHEFSKWVHYLDPDKFEYVCVYVANMGSSGSKEVDYESPNLEDRIREVKTVSNSTKERMKDLFQTNQRRVFLTNLKMSGVGIDLHDVSKGGMHPRTALASPGLEAKTLIQFLGRFEREGQTSECFRLVAYVDNVRGKRSWEAAFMEKLAQKVQNIRLLHNGEDDVDIIQSINEDDGGIIKSIVEEIKNGIIQIGQPMPQPVSGPLASGGRPNVSPVVVSDVIANALARRPPAPVVQAGLNVQNPFLTMRVESEYVMFDTSDKPNSQEVTAQIVRVLNNIKLSAAYFLPVATGVVIYRPGFIVLGLSQTQMLAEVEAATGLKTRREDVAEGTLKVYGLKPEVVIDRLLVVFESHNSFLLGPGYPLETLFPKSMLAEGELTIEPVARGIIRFRGTAARILAAYYAVRTIALEQAPEIFKSFEMKDSNNIWPTFDRSLLIDNVIRDGKYILVTHGDVAKFIPAVIGTVPVLIAPLVAGKILEKTLIRYDNGIVGIVVLPEYQAFITKILGREPRRE